MSRHLLFVVLAGQGHVTPTLPLVAELVRRGHRVEYATGPEHVDDVAAAGARPVPLPGLPPFRPPEHVVGPPVMARWMRHYFAAQRAVYPVLLAHAAAARPDTIVHDETNWPAGLVAGELGVPAVRTIPNLASNEHWSLHERMTAPIDDADPALLALADDCARFAAEAGVPFDLAATWGHPEPLNLVFVPRDLQPAAETFDERFAFLGPVLGDRDRDAYDPPDPDRPLLYVSLGSIFTGRPDLYRACLEAFADDAWQVAMTVGDTDVAALGPVPAHVDVRPWFPQLAVLRRARVFLTHSGMNSTTEALWSGVPMVTLPQMPEQAVNADRVTELGLGERLPDVPSAADLRAVVDRVAADPAIRTAVDGAAERVRAGGGAARGADLIESHLTTR